VANYNFDLHPEFPHKVLVVVEQPRNEMYRFIYDPASETFSRSTIKSLIYIRGFSGIYGWIGGTGVPPGPHHDILLFTGQSPACGDILTGYICGVFLRRDNDHKFVAVDEEIRQSMATADISFLDKVLYDELLRLYPRVDEGEGWYGAEVAIAHLLMKPLHE
jgi:inorganic pyrophosphatase